MSALDDDAAALRAYAEDEARQLNLLPPKAERDRDQEAAAHRIRESARAVRDRFLARHADAVYAALTGGYADRPSLPDLVFAAAERFAGLTPTRAAMDAERGQVQAAKEGLEIDQGLFFRGLLRSPAAGGHLVETMLLATPRARDLLPGFERTGRCELPTLLIERQAGAAEVSVRNLHCLNAEDNALIEDMETAVDLVLLDDRVRVGVLRGAPMTHPKYAGRRVFSAGINLTDLRDGRISFVDFLLRRELGYVNKLRRGLIADPDAAYPHRTVQKPWIAAVDTFAIGGGMQLLFVMDRVIAADDAYFSLPAAQEGIVPGVANLRLARQAGGVLARRVILGGLRIRATDPEARLICDEVVAPQEMDAAIKAAAGELDNPAVVANRRMLRLAEEPDDAFRAYMAEFAYVQARRLYGPDVIAKVARRP